VAVCILHTHTHTHCIYICLSGTASLGRLSPNVELESASGLGPESEAAVWTKLKEGRGLASTARESETGPARDFHNFSA
jgi:hypothetical protein